MAELTTPVTVRPLAGRADLTRFIKLPGQVHADDPAWVEPLLLERRGVFDPQQPFFEHARWQGFLAWRDGRPVGRISAQVDDLYEVTHGEALGYFGCFDAPDDQTVADALFAAAEAWLRDAGCVRVAGPFHLGINQEVGVLVDGFDTPPYVMMPHHRPWTGGLVEAAGYSRAKDLLAYEVDPAFPEPAALRRLRRTLKDRLVVRQLDRSRLDAELETMRQVFNDAWANNWGFTPFTEAEFRAVGRELTQLLPDDHIHLAEVDGACAAFIVLLPNLNEALAGLDGRLLPFGWAKLLWRLKVRGTRTARVPLMGVRQSFQHTRMGPGLAYAVIHAAREVCLARGIQRVELSWILEDNAGMRHIIEAITGTVSKRYRMYDKPLATAP